MYAYMDKKQEGTSGVQNQPRRKDRFKQNNATVGELNLESETRDHVPALLALK